MNPSFQLLIAALAGVAIGFWMYGDAIDRKLPDAVAWGIAGFIFGILGFVTYFLVVIRPDKKGKPKA